MAFVRYQGTNPGLAPEIVRQPGVTAVYRWNETTREGDNLGSRYMFATPFGGGFFLGPHHGNGNAYLVRPGDDGRSPAREKIDLGDRVGDMALYGEGGDTIDVGGRGRIYRFGARPFRVAADIPVTGCSDGDAPGAFGPGIVNMIRRDRATGSLFASRDVGKAVVRLDPENPSGAVCSPPLPPARWTWDVAVDSPSRRHYISVSDFFGWSVWEGDNETMGRIREARLPGALGFFIDADERGRRILAASLFSGELIWISMDDLSVVKRLPLGFGVRDLTVDEKRRRVYVSNYFRGALTAVNLDRFEPVGRLFFGPILRKANIGPDGEQLAVRSSAGIFAVRIDEAFPPTADEPEALDGRESFFGRAFRALLVRTTIPTFPLLIDYWKE
ncbi:MAG: hypothetical protein M5R36_14145 [Deltaproteobacteria bacterium]|nr:hypothetical protein [Deltaproteobacteria bacterium]